jgi:hypothetical protein
LKFDPFQFCQFSCKASFKAPTRTQIDFYFPGLHQIPMGETSNSASREVSPTSPPAPQDSLLFGCQAPIMPSHPSLHNNQHSQALPDQTSAHLTCSPTSPLNSSNHWHLQHQLDLSSQEGWADFYGPAGNNGHQGVVGVNHQHQSMVNKQLPGGFEDRSSHYHHSSGVISATNQPSDEGLLLKTSVPHR